MVQLLLRRLDLSGAFPELAFDAAQVLLELGDPLPLGLPVDLQRSDLVQDFLALLAQQAFPLLAHGQFPLQLFRFSV